MVKELLSPSFWIWVATVIFFAGITVGKVRSQGKQIKEIKEQMNTLKKEVNDELATLEDELSAKDDSLKKRLYDDSGETIYMTRMGCMRSQSGCMAHFQMIEKEVKGVKEDTGKIQVGLAELNGSFKQLLKDLPTIVKNGGK